MTAWMVAMTIFATNPFRYSYLPIAAVGTTRRTHVCTAGPVTYVRQQADGDWHVTLDDGTTRLVLEIIPRLPLPVPRKGQRVWACGITRDDHDHGWRELHPVESLRVFR
jgi:hypothetical protein